MKYKEHDTVELEDGRSGTIVLVHNANTFEVEIFENGVTVDIETIEIEQIAKISI